MTFKLSWSWNGQRLAPPLQIARRLLMFPLYLALRLLLVAVAFIGWGSYEARKVWSDTQ